MRTETEIDNILNSGLESLKNSSLNLPVRRRIHRGSKWVLAGAACAGLLAIYALRPRPVYALEDLVTKQPEGVDYRLENIEKLKSLPDFKVSEYIKVGDRRVTCYYVRMQRLTMEDISENEKIIGSEQLNANVKCMISHDDFFYMRIPNLDNNWKVGEWRTTRRRGLFTNGKMYSVTDYSKTYSEVKVPDFGNPATDPRTNVSQFMKGIDVKKNAKKVKSRVKYRGVTADVWEVVSPVSLYTIWVDADRKRLLEVENDFQPKSPGVRAKIAKVTPVWEKSKMVFHYDTKNLSQYFDIPSQYTKVESK